MSGPSSFYGLRVIESPHLPPDTLYIFMGDCVLFPTGFTAAAKVTGWRFDYFLRLRSCGAIRWTA